MKRTFVFGAGFSKPAGMPLATEVLPMLQTRIEIDELGEWIEAVEERSRWLCRASEEASSTLNIEEIFHHAHFDIEVFRMRQHLSEVGRPDGWATSWNQGEQISHWLSVLEDELRDVIFDTSEGADLAPVLRWASCVADGDAVLTFNYYTLAERSLEEVGRRWTHFPSNSADQVTAVCKLHGSIDWIVAHRSIEFSKLDLAKLQSMQARARLFSSSLPPCLRGMMCSI